MRLEIKLLTPFGTRRPPRHLRVCRRSRPGRRGCPKSPSRRSPASDPAAASAPRAPASDGCQGRQSLGWS
eukprot:6579673-Pyramimonas_sp.AAC.1